MSVSLSIAWPPSISYIQSFYWCILTFFALFFPDKSRNLSRDILPLQSRKSTFWQISSPSSISQHRLQANKCPVFIMDTIHSSLAVSVAAAVCPSVLFFWKKASKGMPNVIIYGTLFSNRDIQWDTVLDFLPGLWSLSTDMIVQIFCAEFIQPSK